MNIKLMKQQFSELGLTKRLSVFRNGQEAIDHFDKLLQTREQMASEKSLQPVALLLVDINVPIVSGLELTKYIKKKFDQLNNGSTLGGMNSAKILRPLIVYVSQTGY